MMKSNHNKRQEHPNKPNMKQIKIKHLRRPSSVDSIIKERLGEQRLMGTLFEAMHIVYSQDKYQSDGDEEEDGAKGEEAYLEELRKNVKQKEQERVKILEKKKLEEEKKQEEQQIQKFIQFKCQCVKNTQGKIKKRCQACKIKRQQFSKKKFVNNLQINHISEQETQASSNLTSNNRLDTQQQQQQNIENPVSQRKSLRVQLRGLQQLQQQQQQQGLESSQQLSEN